MDSNLNPASSSSASSRPTYEPFLDFDRFFDDSAHTRPSVIRTVSSSSSTLVINDNPPPRPSNLALSAFKPRMDLHEDIERNTVTVMLELPGVKKEDIDVQVEGGWLTVTAENKLPSDFAESGYAVREMRYGHFLRSINLPRGVEAKDMTASMSDGILRLTFPRVFAETKDSETETEMK